MLSWTPLSTFSFVIIPVSEAFLFVLPDGCASDLSACYRRKPASAHANLCQCCVYYSLQTTKFFLETNIVKREMRLRQSVETTHPNEHTLFCSVSHISFKYLLAYAKTAQDTWLCYLALCPAACLCSLLAVPLALATVFVLTLQWQCLVTGSAIYMYCRTWLLPWPCSRSRVSCSTRWTSAFRWKIQGVKALLETE